LPVTASGSVDAEASEGFEDSTLGEGGSASCEGCAILANASISPQSLALDTNNVYWTNAASGSEGGIAGSIDSVAQGSVAGMASALVPVAGPLIITFASGWLVWSASGTGSGTGTVSQMSTNGMVSTPGTALISPWGVAVDAKSVYWVSSGGPGVGILVQSAPVGTAAASIIGTIIATYDTPWGLAVNGTDLFFAATSSVMGGGAVFQLPIAGGTPQPVWTTMSGQPQDVGLDSSNVYWVDQTTGTLYSTPLATAVSGASPKVLSTAFTTPVHLVVDSTNVYVADNGTGAGSGSIFEIPTAGGVAPTPLASGLDPPLAVALGSSSLVFFSTQTAIMSVPKK
jgi:hypothetical protein